MPQKNVPKDYVPYSFYHVYTRGVDKREVFCDEADYHYFIDLFKRYLSLSRKASKLTYTHPNYGGEIDLVCFCLMKNHLHLLLFVYENPKTLRSLMSSLLVSYSMYFNRRYDRSGALFESHYKAKRIHRDEYYIHISRYIHMNPPAWQTYPYSSLSLLYGMPVDWLKPSAVTDIFKSKKDYFNFLIDYAPKKQEIKTLKKEFFENS